MRMHTMPMVNTVTSDHCERVFFDALSYKEREREIRYANRMSARIEGKWIVSKIGEIDELFLYYFRCRIRLSFLLSFVTKAHEKKRKHTFDMLIYSNGFGKTCAPGIRLICFYLPLQFTFFCLPSQSNALGNWNTYILERENQCLL